MSSCFIFSKSVPLTNTTKDGYSLDMAHHNHESASINNSIHILVFLQAVLEKQSYMLIGRHDIEQLMRLDPASAYLPNAFGQSNMETHASDGENYEVELELSELLLNLRPIKQVSFYLSDCMFTPFVLFLS